MFKINHDLVSNILEIKDSEKKIFGKIFLNCGASLQELTLGGHSIIENLVPLNYDTTYASAILFPFANRVKDGAYTFKGESYQLEPNQKEEHNALHGLVYNKTFEVINKKTSNNSAEVTLEYIENKKSKGFPFTYSIKLVYSFTKDTVSLNAYATNTDSKPFPFTIGWHPYFTSENLSESTLNFDSSEKLLIGDRNITMVIEKIKPVKTFYIKNQQLDDCWVLKSNQAIFNTPKYQLSIGSSVNNNFLQAYTPPKDNVIAIEPTTGVSDSFNNEIGLQTLNANESFDITWNLEINNN